MGNFFLSAGILLNSALIVTNRFVKRLPDRIQFPLLILGLGLILAGFVIIQQ